MPDVRTRGRTRLAQSQNGASDLKSESLEWEPINRVTGAELGSFGHAAVRSRTRRSTSCAKEASQDSSVLAPGGAFPFGYPNLNTAQWDNAADTLNDRISAVRFLCDDYQATAAIPSPSRGQARTLDAIAQLVAAGHQLVVAGQYTGACEIVRREGRTEVVERPTHGGAARVVFEYRGEGVVYLADRSWDGKSVLVSVAERTGRTVQLVPVDGSKPTVVGGETVSPSTARISPDGRWLAFASYQTAQPQVYVSPIPPTGEQWPVSAGGGEHPQWRSDGRELFFIAPDGSLMSAAIAPGAKLDVAAPRLLFKTGLTGDPASQRFVVTAEGNRFLFNMLHEGDRAATTTTLQVVLNWTSGLAR